LTDDIEPLFDELVERAKTVDKEADQSSVVRNLIREEAERRGIEVPAACPA